MLAELLAAGADPNRPDKQGIAPLYVAAQNARLPAVQLLLHGGAAPGGVRMEQGACVAAGPEASRPAQASQR